MKDVKPNTKALKKESSSDEEDSDDEDEGEEEEASKTPKKNVTLSSSFYILLNSVEKKQALMIMHHLAFAFSGLSSIIPVQTCTAFYFTITVFIWFKKCLSCSQLFFFNNINRSLM